MSVPRLLRRWLGLRCLLHRCPTVPFRGPDGDGPWAVCVDCDVAKVYRTGSRRGARRRRASPPADPAQLALFPAAAE